MFCSEHCGSFKYRVSDVMKRLARKLYLSAMLGQDLKCGSLIYCEAQ